MAYPLRLDAAAIAAAARELVRAGGRQALSLRPLAASLGVRAPSLYRYYPDRESLEGAVAELAAAELADRMEGKRKGRRGGAALKAIAGEYLAYSREEPALFAMLLAAQPGPESKRLWNLLLAALEPVTGRADDTAAAVALWSFLHGFATLEAAGQFGASGPRGGYERGLSALLAGLRL
ncbi:MAG: WHG domain-containing protein [Acidobacteria bacterium]|jgi:AcrR family transcriptional regulator|nr:WHG domain-containing protein [Bryobacteraceae bacterium CoA2 C42]MCA2965090.1 WHG domain-containing protein [Acidobacteriaceae bacterium]